MLELFTQITVLSILLSSGLGATALRHYNIVNNCPTAIDFVIKGDRQGSLAAGATTTRDFGSWWNGFFYTSSNGGDSGGLGTTRAGFNGEKNYYYIVVDPSHFNTAVSITPINKTATGGFCPKLQCDSVACTAFQLSPASFPTPIAGVPPKPPLYECPDQTAGYTITFCPDGKFPTSNPSRTLHPNGNTKKCLDVRGAVYANGTPVQIYDCNGTGAQQWVLSRGSTKIKVAGKNFCLDAGSSPKNGIGMKIWQCYDNLPAQQWYYTGDDRIAPEGKGLCLDLTNGVTVNSNRVQTWQCTNGNKNQVWDL